MMTHIQLDNVNLDYIIKTGSESIKQTVMALLGRRSASARRSVFNTSYRALTDITLSFCHGDRVGILGRNGAGKSTLLRVLGGIYAPTLGTVSVQGKVNCLFDMSAGMNPEATGYENIVHLAVLRGLKKKEANDIVEDVADFTELGQFLSQPVRTYSAGMQLKLTFGVATKTSADILLVDEVIGVGDAVFMKKATARIETMIRSSGILVLTSHSEDAIRQFCNKAIVLEQGHLIFSGGVDEAIAHYNSRG